jgi:manganese oxidase
MISGRSLRLYSAALPVLVVQALAPAPPVGLPLPVARLHDNLIPAGRLDGDRLALELDVVMAAWYPESPSGAAAHVAAFAEGGGDPVVPGPLIRIRQGTLVRVTLRNRLPDTLSVFGLHAHPAPALHPVVLPSGATREIEFTAGEPGTYFYWATAHPQYGLARQGEYSQLNGALVVDAAGGPPPADRIFLMSIRGGPPQPGAEPRVVMAMNGRSFPHTERLELRRNDTIAWRVINATAGPHPMHMHGFYYHIESRGDLLQDTAYAAADQPFVVTEHMRPGATMRIRFVPHEPGFWAFHCHFAFHSGGHLGLEPHEHYGEPAHLPHAMAGLVLVYHVQPDAHYRPPILHAPRPVRLLVKAAPDTTLAGQRLAFQLHETGAEPDTDSFALPSPPLILRRGEPVAITIVNRLREPTQVHWHGIELESYPDGIPGISGTPGRITPPIAPADSFTAIFAPPRAGTFIYHAHMNDGFQINLGLYGPLLVVDDEVPYDPSRDHIIMVGGGGRVSEDRLVPGLVNGTDTHEPVEMRAGQTHRLRLISIHPDEQLEWLLIGPDGAIGEWRAVAKDGAELPPNQRRTGPARLLSGAGETADFEFTPRAPGHYRMLVLTAPRAGPGWLLRVPIRVL